MTVYAHLTDQWDGLGLRVIDRSAVYGVIENAWAILLCALGEPCCSVRLWQWAGDDDSSWRWKLASRVYDFLHYPLTQLPQGRDLLDLPLSSAQAHAFAPSDLLDMVDREPKSYKNADTRDHPDPERWLFRCVRCRKLRMKRGSWLGREDWCWTCDWVWSIILEKRSDASPLDRSAPLVTD